VQLCLNMGVRPGTSCRDMHLGMGVPSRPLIKLHCYPKVLAQVDAHPGQPPAQTMACMASFVDSKGFIDVTDAKGTWLCVATCVPCKRDNGILRVCSGWLFEQYSDVGLRGGFYGKTGKIVQCPRCRHDHGGLAHKPEWVVYESIDDLGRAAPWRWPVAGKVQAPPGTVGNMVPKAPPPLPTVIPKVPPGLSSGANDRAARSPGMRAAMTALSSSGNAETWAAPGVSTTLRRAQSPKLFTEHSVTESPRGSAAGASVAGASAASVDAHVSQALKKLK
jgi:hypothetical protein